MAIARGLDQFTGRWRNDGTLELDNDRNRHAIDLLYGWNSEDDIYFPTPEGQIGEVPEAATESRAEAQTVGRGGARNGPEEFPRRVPS